MQVNPWISYIGNLFRHLISRRRVYARFSFLCERASILSQFLLLALNGDRNAKWVFMCSYRKRLSERLFASLRWYYFVSFISIFFFFFFIFQLNEIRLGATKGNAESAQATEENRRLRSQITDKDSRLMDLQSQVRSRCQSFLYIYILRLLPTFVLFLLPIHFFFSSSSYFILKYFLLLSSTTILLFLLSITATAVWIIVSLRTPRNFGFVFKSESFQARQ